MMEMMLARSVMCGGSVSVTVVPHRTSGIPPLSPEVRQQELAGGAMGLYALQ
jgi:hypothetical protein